MAITNAQLMALKNDATTLVLDEDVTPWTPIKDWLIFLEIYSQPMRIKKHPAGTQAPSLVASKMNVTIGEKEEQ